MEKAIKGSHIGIGNRLLENEPNIDTELLEMADIATPRCGYSADGKWTATKMTLENLCDFFHFDIDPVKLCRLFPLPKSYHRPERGQPRKTNTLRGSSYI